MSPVSDTDTTGLEPRQTDDLTDGERFLDSLGDGREIWFEGERVAKMTEDPAFARGPRTMTFHQHAGRRKYGVLMNSYERVSVSTSAITYR